MIRFFNPDTLRFHLFFSLLFIAMIIPAPVKAKQELVIDPLLFNIHQADRIILVTYSDKHIDRVPVGGVNQAYRRRGKYSSSTWSKRIAAGIEADYPLKTLTQWSISEIGEHCVVYLIHEDQSVSDIIQALARDSRIDDVQIMSMFRVMAEEYSDPYYRLQTNIHSIRLSEIHSHTTGKDISIAIIDTGVDVKHPDLEGQIRVIKNFVTHPTSDFSSDRHGTAIAGIIAAKTNNEQGIVGIAPDSHIIAMKACWEVAEGNLDAVCNSFTLALALNTAIELKVDVLNLSLTGPYDPLLARLIDKAVQQGIVVIASQTDRLDNKSGFPAQQPGVISVQSFKGNVLNVSQKQQTVLAPGEQILTTLPNGAYDFLSGNSMATAHVSGFVALLMQYERRLTQQDFFNALTQANESNFYQIFNTSLSGRY